MGRYATIHFTNFENKSDVQVKFTGLILEMAYNVGIVCDQMFVDLSFEDVGRIIDRLHLYPIAKNPIEAYSIGLVIAWYGMHNPGDVLEFA